MRDESSSGPASAPPTSEIDSPAGSAPSAAPGTKLWRRRTTQIFALLTLLAAGIVLPPLVNISHYRGQITALMSRSLGRPVHLSGVELRLLPTPGFVLHDLSVSEDPAFGAEPILSARTVVASVGLFSLWRGRLEVSRIGVDEASLNLVRNPQGRWNLESLMMGAGPSLNAPPDPSAPRAKHRAFPYLEATNSRVNLKQGIVKSPFSIVNTDLSISQDQTQDQAGDRAHPLASDWRIRLKGEPVRTDMEMSSADTGELRLEATLTTATLTGSQPTQLRDMPLKLQAEWREAQLGQLSRLLLGSDAGWRGDLRVDLSVVGTVDAAQTKARLRATGVRRQEFAPETPLDFDANCNFRYSRSKASVRDLACDTAIGDGHLNLKANLPADTGQPEVELAVDQVPLQAGLDLLRSLRAGFAPGINARGTATGTLRLQPAPLSAPKAGRGKGLRSVPDARHNRPVPETTSVVAPVPVRLQLQGDITARGGQLHGGALRDPLILPDIVLSPVADPSPANPGSATARSSSPWDTALSTAFSVSLPRTEQNASGPSLASPGPATPSPAGPIAVTLALSPQGYRAQVHGSGPTEQMRDLAYAFGAPHLEAANQFAKGSIDLDLALNGPWLPQEELPSATPISAASQTQLPAKPPAKPPIRPAHASPALPALESPLRDELQASLTLHHTEWRAPYLARPVELTQGTATLTGSGASLTSDFAYGTLKGSLTVNPPPADAAKTPSGGPGSHCLPAECPPQVELHLGALDGNTLQAALLGVPAEKTLFSPILERMRSSQHAKWPQVTILAVADSLILGPVTLKSPQLHLRVSENEILLDHGEAHLLGGDASGTGRFALNADHAEYSVDGDVSHLSAAPLLELLGAAGASGTVSAHGQVKLSGFTQKDLAASATGSLDFDWQGGSITTIPARSIAIRRWKGTVALGNGKAVLGDNTLQASQASQPPLTISGEAPFGGPLRLTVKTPATATQASAPQKQKAVTPRPLR
jgi:hypothetical protein